MPPRKRSRKNFLSQLWRTIGSVSGSRAHECRRSQGGSSTFAKDVTGSKPDSTQFLCRLQVDPGRSGNRWSAPDDFAPGFSRSRESLAPRPTRSRIGESEFSSGCAGTFTTRRQRLPHVALVFEEESFDQAIPRLGTRRSCF